MKERLQNGLTALHLPTENIPALCRYADLLVEKNKVMNLTSITEPQDIASLHFLDSLALLGLTKFAGKSVVDVGTGAGLPGLPLRIVQPDIQLTLLDSLGKRIKFLQEVCDDLGYEDVACIHARAEDFAKEHRETFDIATSRAVASLPLLAELALPLVKPGGVFLAMKSVESGDELTQAAFAIQTLGGNIREVRDYPVFGTDVIHRVIEIEKVQVTPKQYPRAFAKIKKAPLLKR